MSISITGCTYNGKIDTLNSNSDTGKSLNEGDDLMNNDKVSKVRGYAHISTNDTIINVITHPAFQGFGQFILPLEWGYDENMELSSVGSLLPYHSHVIPDQVVNTINHMIDEAQKGKTIFYDFYTQQQKNEDYQKKNTGLFFFKGKQGAPFAIVCPGGGYSYVGSVQEGFPHAIELSKKGYNAFVLQYRVGGEQRACEDLATAIPYIFENADMLGVSKMDYSVWGSSAGARMAANIGSYGAISFKCSDVPKPSIIVMAYTGHQRFTKNDPPTFVTSSEDDPIASVYNVERRVNAMRSVGIDVEYRKYKNASHGFGLGIGTDAAGWIEYAIQFWEKHMNRTND